MIDQHLLHATIGKNKNSVYKSNVQFEANQVKRHHY